MIKDRLENSQIYYNLSKNIKEGFEWLLANDLQSVKDGKYDISDKIYANVQTYATKEDALFEAHRKYIDIQYIVKGKENIGVTNYKNCEPAEMYNPQKDIEFLNSSKSDILSLCEGEFMILYPNDAHKPSLSMNGKKQQVKKIVVKVSI